MQIQCPACQAEYAVADHAIGSAGRNVRCARCKHQWHVAPLTPPKTEPAQSVVESPPVREISPAQAGEEFVAKPAPIRLKWFEEAAPLTLKIAACVLVLAVISALIPLRFPSTVDQPGSNGLRLTEMKANRLPSKDKKELWTVSGKMLNTTSRPLHAPVLRLSLLDNEGEKLQFWEYSDPQKVLEPGESIPFTAEPLEKRFSRGTQIVVELGSEMELFFRPLDVPTSLIPQSDGTAVPHS